MYKSLVILVATFCLFLGMPYVSKAKPPAQEPISTLSSNPSQEISTPKLIEAALNRGEIDQDTANLYLAYALGDYENLPIQYRSNVPWHGTFAMRQLQEKAKTMKTGPKRAKIIEILSGSCSSSTTSLPNISNSTHFHIQYNTIGGGLDINDYRASLETSWSTQIDNFGWAAPPVFASNPPPGNRYHVRIDNLGGGLYGFVSVDGVHAGLVGNNPNTAWNEGDAYASCMVLNNNYSGFPGTPQRALDATTAHEFNHSIQFGYGVLTGLNAADDNLVEGGATWMEDEVFDSANDNYNYLWPSFNNCMGEYAEYPYPYWVTWRGLTERYGTGTAGAGEQVMQDFWEATSQSTTSNMFSALNSALINKGTTLADAYHAYAIAVKFNKSCGGGYSYPYCFEEGADYVATAGSTLADGSITTVGNGYNGNIADNYALNWVSLPTTGVYSVTLQNISTGGQLRGSVVCDTGSALDVNALPVTVGSGNFTTLTNFNPAGCNSVVAVVTNQAQTGDNPNSCAVRSYRLTTGDIDVIPATFVYLPYIMKSNIVTSPGCPPSPSSDSDNISDALKICSGNTVSGRVDEFNDLDDVYKIWIAGTKQLTISMNGTGGDADLYLYFPDATDVFTDVPADASANFGNDEFIQGVATSGGSGEYWYIDVYSYSGTTNYNLTVTLSSPKTGTKTFELSGTTQPRVRNQPKVSP